MVQTFADAYNGARGILPFEDIGQSGAVSGAITASGQTVVVPVAAQNGVVFAWWGTFAGIALAFEACYEESLSNWVAVSAQSASGGSPATSVSSISTLAAYEVYAPGALAVRIRSTAYTSGTMNVRAVPVSMMQDVAPAVAGGNLIIGGVQAYASSGGISSVNRLLSAAASVNATSVKAAAGRLYKVRGYNSAAAVRYLKLYNKASAPTVGTDVPVAVHALKPSDVFDVDFGSIGEYFATGIAFALTTGSSDADTGALTAADIVGMSTFYI